MIHLRYENSYADENCAWELINNNCEHNEFSYFDGKKGEWRIFYVEADIELIILEIH